MAKIEEELINFAGKVWVWIVGIIIGVMGKICYEIMVGKKLSLLQVIATAGVSIAVGCITAFLCISKGMEPMYGTFVCACATWLGDKLAIACISINWNKIADEIARLKLKGK